jgi:hypothetical protein
MEQADARRRAKEISEKTGDIAVAVTVRQRKDGTWMRGGWPSEDQTWAVIDHVTGHLIEVDPPQEGKE